MPIIRGLNVGEHPQLVPLPEAGTHAFMVSQYSNEPVFHFLWHYHAEVELVWIRKGSGLRYVGRSVERFESGDLVLLGSRLPHTWASAPNQSTKAAWSVIQFLPKHWSIEFWRLPEVHKLNKLFAQAGRGIQFTGPTIWQIGQQIEELAALPAHSLEGLIQFLTIFERLLHAPIRILNTVHAGVDSMESDPRVEQLLEWVQTHFAEPITQAQAAAEVKMSPAAFSRWFKVRVGRVFQRYLNELRVAKVCGQLTDSEEGITQAAFKCGYNNLANFNRRFREITGLTPTKFRSQTQQMQEQNARNFLIRLGANSAVRISPKAHIGRHSAI
ncbi:MAG TPA: AraC family transcriptional regulator [Verrucomicrobiae bacterium]|nr:AraC family transcriptional regulator [Verrucomicrobiae bacterium]